eukprot:12075386-Heterocapsa_arctica.AAC.1
MGPESRSGLRGPESLDSVLKRRQPSLPSRIAVRRASEDQGRDPAVRAVHRPAREPATSTTAGRLRGLRRRHG